MGLGTADGASKRTHFRENFLGNGNFRENENFCETKFRENLLIFASFSLFAKLEKTVFVSTLLLASLVVFFLSYGIAFTLQHLAARFSWAPLQRLHHRLVLECGFQYSITTYVFTIKIPSFKHLFWTAYLFFSSFNKINTGTVIMNCHCQKLLYFIEKYLEFY
jgi:hypothetical protein